MKTVSIITILLSISIFLFGQGIRPDVPGNTTKLSTISQSKSTILWNGSQDSDWTNINNWNGGNVPTINDDVEIQSGCTYYPIITTSCACHTLTINSNAQITIDGGTLNPTGNCNLLEDAQLTLNTGTLYVYLNINTRANSEFIMNDGALYFNDWMEDSENDLYYAKGNIVFAGGTITGQSLYLSNTESEGEMSGDFEMTLSGNLYTADNWDITGGHIILNHSAWSGPIGFTATEGGTSIGRVCEVTLNFTSLADYTAIPFAINELIVYGDLNIVKGKMRTHKNFWYDVIVDTLTINGDIIIETQGEFDFDQTTTVCRLTGDWRNNGGGFDPAEGTIVFDGAQNTIYGDNNFFNLKKEVGESLTFEASKEQSVSSIITLEGSEGNTLTLQSTEEGSHWYLDPSGDRNISYVEVQDGYNSTLPVIDPSNSYDLGNNVNWFEATDITTEKASSFSLFPNPAKEYITVEFKNIKTKSANLRIVNSSSVVVYEKTINIANNNNEYTIIKLNDLSKGVYTVTILDIESKETLHTERIIVL